MATFLGHQFLQCQEPAGLYKITETNLVVSFPEMVEGTPFWVVKGVLTGGRAPPVPMSQLCRTFV